MFLEDIADVNIYADPYLNGDQQQGIAWAALRNGGLWEVGIDDNVRGFSSAPTHAPSWLATVDGSTWTDYACRVKLRHFGVSGLGFLLRAKTLQQQDQRSLQSNQPRQRIDEAENQTGPVGAQAFTLMGWGHRHKAAESAHGDDICSSNIER